MKIKKGSEILKLSDLIYNKAPIADSTNSTTIVGNFEKDSFFFRELESAGIKLNERQTEAVRHEDGACVIISPAGAGKTAILTNRVNRLVNVCKVDPSSILMLTYSNKAAKEMIEKLGKLPLMSEVKAKKVKSGTFHSVSLSILREHGDSRDIWSSNNTKAITIKTIMRKLGIEDSRYKPEDILSRISNYKNNFINFDEIEENEQFIKIWREYELHKKTKNLIDFDDMLYDLYKLFKKNKTILNKIINRYKYILIDEYQDSNKGHDTLVEMIAHSNKNIFVVGDFRQTIFSFNGSKIDNILNFHNKYENTKVIPLEVNYRSSDYIVGLGSYIINKNGSNFDNTVIKSVKPSNIEPRFIQPISEDEEARFIVREIQNIVSSGEYKYSDFSILFRTNANSRAVFEELLSKNVNFIFYGNDEIFYENQYIKPLIEYLRLSFDPNNIKSVEAICTTLMISKDKVMEIKQEYKKDNSVKPLDLLLKCGLKPYHRSKVEDRIRMIHTVSNLRPIVAIKRLRTAYEEFLIGEDAGTTTTLHREIIKETLDELESSCKKFSSNQEFVEYVDELIKNAKIQQNLQKKKDYDGVKLMTIHRSKGLEFKFVYGISLVEGNLPHKSSFEECTDVIGNATVEEQIEEENRLLYVLITRAEDFLTLSIPKSFRNKPAIPSRFLEEFVGEDESNENKDKFEKEFESVFS